MDYFRLLIRESQVRAQVEIQIKFAPQQQERGYWKVVKTIMGLKLGIIMTMTKKRIKKIKTEKDFQDYLLNFDLNYIFIDFESKNNVDGPSLQQNEDARNISALDVPSENMCLPSTSPAIESLHVDSISGCSETCINSPHNDLTQISIQELQSPKTLPQKKLLNQVEESSRGW